MCGLTFGQQFATLRISQFISEVDHFLPHMSHVGAHDNLVIIVHGSLVTAARVDNGNEAVVLALHIFITETHLAEELHPPHFKPDEMIGVIDDTHLIGFSIAYADASFIRRRRCFPIYIDRNRCIGLAHRPVHFGLRFSRKDSMPSRKSELSRIPAFSRMAASIWTS